MGTENKSFCENSIFMGGGGSGGSGWGGGGGQGGWERRIEPFVKIQKKKFWRGGGSGGGVGVGGGVGSGVGVGEVGVARFGVGG